MVAVDRNGSGTPVLCLHGWPGGPSDYRLLSPLLAAEADVVVPHLLGYADSFEPADAQRPPSDFGRDAQVRMLVELIDSLGLDRPVVVGYDVGATLAVTLGRTIPDRLRGIVVGNALPPSQFGPCALDDDHRAEFWYQDFHQLEVCAALCDGNPAAVRDYLGHFWSHWGNRPDAALTEELVEAYSRPGAFTAALNWYRSGSATLATALSLRGASELPPPVEVPTTMLWGAQDPLYPRRFADAAGELFPHGTVRVLDDVGHFTPLEAAGEMAEAVREFL